jgi:hypothetical protein
MYKNFFYLELYKNKSKNTNKNINKNTNKTSQETVLQEKYLNDMIIQLVCLF